MLYEEVHYTERRTDRDPLYSTYSPYFDDFGTCPGDTELADEALAKHPDPILNDY